jgi:hypothetical protein
MINHLKSLILLPFKPRPPTLVALDFGFPVRVGRGWANSIYRQGNFILNAVNGLMVFIDILLYYRNRRLSD